MIEQLLQSFAECYGHTDGILTYFSPGRVNLIGEHTDYNGGHVFPCALTIGTYAAVRPNGERVHRFFSGNVPKSGVITVSMDDLSYKKQDGWANYMKGMFYTLQEKGHVLDKGLDVYIFGNIPNSSGLSSSASVEMLAGYFLSDIFSLGLDNLQLALLAQEAENRYNGVNCGIMDQFAVAMGRKDMAMFLDTATLEYTYVPVKLQGIRLVLASSNKKRGLADSKYNERRAECEEALRELQTVLPIKSLGELTTEEFEKHASLIASPVRRRRARHAVTENQRAIEAVRILQEGNIERFGELMNASHRSLKEDYEVTGLELDTLVETAWETEGVVGSRMTGAGFGGCTVSLVREDAVENFIRKVGEKYLEVVGYSADFYVVEIGEGTHALREE